MQRRQAASLCLLLCSCSRVSAWQPHVNAVPLLRRGSHLRMGVAQPLEDRSVAKVQQKRPRRPEQPAASPKQQRAPSKSKPEVKTPLPPMHRSSLMGGRKQPLPPPQPEEDVVDGYCILGDVFALATYSAVSAGADVIFSWAQKMEQVRNSALHAFFQPMGAPELLAINDPFLTGTLLTTAWLVAGSALKAFSPRATQGTVFEALMATGRVWLGSAMLVLGCLLVNGVIRRDIGLNEADLEYIVGSLTVLVMWRSMYAYLFGTGD